MGDDFCLGVSSLSGSACTSVFCMASVVGECVYDDNVVFFECCLFDFCECLW